ncbi:general transcription factor 3C polypeptide 1-like isoform X1 [Osmerus eperlanus]|uniref:general transcription factor 3C polypeptide 1-like isoform X1 n=1 Tax=Osmerus eperlanus TaxID=29151 RepID=UPI002E165571
MDALEVLLDEVALEGLDGITLPSLWIRLESRKPPFGLSLDTCTKDFLWKSLARNADVNFYQMPKERADVVLLDRFADIDPNTGIQVAQQFDGKSDVYPVHVLVDDPTGVQGSCLYYQDRKDVTGDVRTADLTPRITLEEAFEKWARRLVVTAGQQVRFRTLIGPQGDPELQLSDHSYCILERVGRGRWQGELQRDLHTCSFKTDAGKMHYMRKSLVQHGLITMETHVTRTPSGQQQQSILLGLPRFHVDRRSKYDILMEATSNALLDSHDHTSSLISLRDQLRVNDRTFKRVSQYMMASKLVQLVKVPLQEINPSAGPCLTTRGSRSLVRGLKLLKPYVRKEVLIEEDDDDDDEDGTGNRKSLPSEGRVMECDLISQAYGIVLSSGTKGLSQSALRSRMCVGQLESRMICRLLQRNNVIKGFMEDEGRQRTTKFISHRYVSQSHLLQQFTQEEERNEKLLSSGGSKPASGKKGAPKPASGEGRPPKPASGEGRPPKPASGEGRPPKPASGEGRPPKPASGEGRPPKPASEQQGPPKSPSLEGVAPKPASGDGGATRPRTRGTSKTTPSREASPTTPQAGDTPISCEEEGRDGEGGGKEGAGEKKKRGIWREGLPSLLKQTTLNFPVSHFSPVKSKAPPPSTASDRKVPEAESLPSAGEEGEGPAPPSLSLDEMVGGTMETDQPQHSITFMEDDPRLKVSEGPPSAGLWGRSGRRVQRHHQTYRLLRRKNMIIECVRSLRVVEGLFTLQKMIREAEVLEGVKTRCCRKTIVRLIHSLSREGMLKMFTTTIIQDGLSKKVDLIVHPSISQTDPIVKSAIEQVRFRLSSSYTAARAQAEEGGKEGGRGKERGSEEEEGGKEQGREKVNKGKRTKKFQKSREEMDKYKPTTVKGLSRCLGYQPKMHRLRLVHTFLWYVIYGHPLRYAPASPLAGPAHAPASPLASPAHAPASPLAGPAHAPDSPLAGPAHAPASPLAGPAHAPDSPLAGPAHAPASPLAGPAHAPASPLAGPAHAPASPLAGPAHAPDSPLAGPANFPESLLAGPAHAPASPLAGPAHLPDSSLAGPAYAQPVTEPAPTCQQEVRSLVEKEGAEFLDSSELGHFDPHVKVYSEELTWRRFVPPSPLHQEFGPGWALSSDTLLCLPLSIFTQIIQINFTIEGLDAYLSDPEKQHYLIRFLPSRIQRQLLFKRKYIFSFHESMQRLVFMGLLQFSPTEKFQDKDQVFLYLKRNAVIVDTTSCEPHYSLASPLPGRPFERRSYCFLTADDVDNYWFDLLCVCLNTPLGVIRPKKSMSCQEEEQSVTTETTEPSEVPWTPKRNEYQRLLYTLRGSREVCDEAVVPGDGRGAGGLDSDFYSHLKRNWIWTSQLLDRKRNNACEVSSTIRLKSLLNKQSFSWAARAGSTFPGSLTNKQSLISLLEEKVTVATEPASRNQQVRGGKKRERKRPIRKQVAKVPAKIKKVVVRRPAHDEADRRALKRMTRRRVVWTLREDSFLMLCSVASRLLNRQLRRPFVPYCEVRDLLHADLSESLDKTSVAIARRTRYIMKNPHTHLNYRICLAEVSQDSCLMDTLDRKKPSNPNDATECANAFRQLVVLLRQKFSSAAVTQSHTIPTSKQALFSRFKVLIIDQGKERVLRDNLNCIEDIHSLVLNNLIQSTLVMSNTQMKSCRSFQTFHMYSRYGQELLCQAFLSCRKNGLVNRRRINQQGGPKKNRALPILPMSYQLSQTYYRCFAWRFPAALCSEAFHFLETLRDNKTTDHRPMTSFHNKTVDRGSGERLEEERMEEERDQGRTERTCEVKGGEAGGGAGGGGGAGEGDENTDPENTGKTPEAPNDPETSRDDAPPQPSLPQTELPVPGPAPAAGPVESLEPPDEEGMLQFPVGAAGGAVLACLSLMTLGMLSVSVGIPKHIVVVDSSLVDTDSVKRSMAALEEEEEEEGRRGGSQSEHAQLRPSSHTGLLLLRGCWPAASINLRQLSNNDCVVVESCSVKLTLRSQPAHTLFTPECPPLDSSIQGSSLLPPFLTRPVPLPSSPPLPSFPEGYTPQDLAANQELLKALQEAGPYGVEGRDFLLAFAHLQEPRDGRTHTLQQYIQDLQEAGQMLQLGGASMRLVLLAHAEPWLLTTTQRSRTDQDQSQDQGLPLGERGRKRGLEDREDQGPPGKKVAREGEGKEGRDRGEDGDRMEEEGGEQSFGEEREREQGGMEREEDRGGEEELERREEGERVCKSSCSSTTSLTNQRAAAEDDGRGVCEEVRYVSRPWRMVDGGLNRPTLKGMLEAVLYHIMTQPGLSQRSLLEHYRHVLQPVVVLDLVQTLVSLGCVRRRFLASRPRPSLFSRPCPGGGEGVRREGGWGEGEGQFYEASVDGCLRLGQLFPSETNWNQCTTLSQLGSGRHAIG